MFSNSLDFRRILRRNESLLSSNVWCEMLSLHLPFTCILDMSVCSMRVGSSINWGLFPSSCGLFWNSSGWPSGSSLREVIMVVQELLWSIFRVGQQHLIFCIQDICDLCCRGWRLELNILLMFVCWDENWFLLLLLGSVHTFVISLHLHRESRTSLKSAEQEIILIYFDVNVFQ